MVPFAHVDLNAAHRSSAVFIFSRFASDYLISSVMGSAWRGELAATEWKEETSRRRVKEAKDISCFSAGNLSSVLIPSASRSTSVCVLHNDPWTCCYSDTNKCLSVADTFE